MFHGIFKQAKKGNVLQSMCSSKLENYVKIATLNVPETWGFVIRVSEVDSSRSKRVAQWAPPEALINIFAKLKITLNM